MPSTLIYRKFTRQRLVPATIQHNADCFNMPVTLPVGSTYNYGNLLLPPSGTGTSAVQTITAPGSSTYIINGVNPLTGFAWSTAALAFGATDSQVAAAINAVINGPANVNSPGTAFGGASVTVTSLAVTFGGTLANTPVPLMTLTTSGSGSPGVANTTPGVAPGTYTLYAGSGSPRAILEYTTTVDQAGLIGFALQGGGGEHGELDSNTPAYFRGCFFCSDLPNLDANAITTMGGRIINSSASVSTAITTPGTIVYFP